MKTDAQFAMKLLLIYPATAGEVRRTAQNFGFSLAFQLRNHHFLTRKLPHFKPTQAF